MHVGQEAVAAAGQGLDEPWTPRIVAECRADRCDAEVQAAIELDEGGAAPDVAAKVVPAHDLTGPNHEEREDLQGLSGEMDEAALETQLTGLGVELERTEPQSRHRGAILHPLAGPHRPTNA
jgi:hypothetical protein